MASSILRLKAIDLRSQGVSIKQIAMQLKISTSSASKWTRDINLTSQQLDKLRINECNGKALGRLKSTMIKKEIRLEKIEKSRREGAVIVGNINKRELLLLGLALYWGEGGKKNRRVEFCNSDPRMVKFLILWLIKCFEVRSEDLICWVGINEIHEPRESIVREYWSKVLNLPLGQFRKTSYKRVKSKKVYANFDQHFGTLSIVVAKSTNLYYQIMGLIDSLYGSVAQW